MTVFSDELRLINPHLSLIQSQPVSLLRLILLQVDLFRRGQSQTRDTRYCQQWQVLSIEHFLHGANGCGAVDHQPLQEGLQGGLGSWGVWFKVQPMKRCLRMVGWLTSCFGMGYSFFGDGFFEDGWLTNIFLFANWSVSQCWRHVNDRHQITECDWCAARGPQLGEIKKMID